MRIKAFQDKPKVSLIIDQKGEEITWNDLTDTWNSYTNTWDFWASLVPSIKVKTRILLESIKAKIS